MKPAIPPITPTSAGIPKPLDTPPKPPLPLPVAHQGDAQRGNGGTILAGGRRRCGISRRY